LEFGDFSVDRGHLVTLSRQIADKLSGAIEAGQFERGEKLPERIEGDVSCLARCPSKPPLV